MQLTMMLRHAHRYGVKLEAVALLQEWIRDIGSVAGLQASPENVRIFSGSVGVPESRLEVSLMHACICFDHMMQDCSGQHAYMSFCSPRHASLHVCSQL